MVFFVTPFWTLQAPPICGWYRLRMADGLTQLIDRLVANCEQVKLLQPPLVRAGLWIVFSGGFVLVATLSHGTRSGMTDHFARPDVMLPFVGALLTGVLATVATFYVSLPGRPRGWRLLPLPALMLWLASLGWGILSDWKRLGSAGLAVSQSFHCFQAILITSLALGSILLLLVRHARLGHPRTTALLSSLSTSALASAGVTLVHDLDTALMVLIWHVGTVGLLTLASWLGGDRLFSWIEGTPERRPS